MSLHIVTSKLGTVYSAELDLPLDRIAFPPDTRVLAHDEELQLGDLIYDLIANQWIEIEEETLVLIQAFGVNNPVPRCRRNDR